MLTEKCSISDFLNADIPHLQLCPKSAFEGLRNAAVLHMSNLMAGKCAFEELRIGETVCSDATAIEKLTRIIAELERLLGNVCKRTPVAVQHVGSACTGDSRPCQRY